MLLFICYTDTKYQLKASYKIPSFKYFITNAYEWKQK